MYSSHSATPVFGLDESVFAVSVFAGAVLVATAVLVVVVEVLAGFALLADVLAAPPPPHPNETRAKQRAEAIAKKLLKFIILKFLTKIVFSVVVPDRGTKIKSIFSLE
jgi:hypothetical protein